MNRGKLKGRGEVRESKEDVLKRVQELKEKQALMKGKMKDMEHKNILPPTNLKLLKRENREMDLRASTSQIRTTKLIGRKSSKLVMITNEESSDEDEGAFLVRSTDATFSRGKDSVMKQHADSADGSARDSGGNAGTYETELPSSSVLLSDSSIMLSTSDETDELSESFRNDSAFDYEEGDSSLASWSDASIATDPDAYKPASRVRPHPLLLKPQVMSPEETKLLNTKRPLIGSARSRPPVRLLHFNQDINVDGIIHRFRRNREETKPAEMASKVSQTSISQDLGTRLLDAATSADIPAPKPPGTEIEVQTEPMEPLVVAVPRQASSPVAALKDKPLDAPTPTKAAAVMLPPAILFNMAKGTAKGGGVAFGSGGASGQNDNYFDRNFLDITDLHLDDLPFSVLENLDDAATSAPSSLVGVVPHGGGMRRVVRKKTPKVRPSPIPKHFEDLLPATVDPEFAHLRGNDRFRRARISQLEKVADKLEGEIDESDETLKKLEKMFGDDGEYESQYSPAWSAEHFRTAK